MPYTNDIRLWLLWRACVPQVVPGTVLDLVDRVAALSDAGLRPPTGRLPAADLRAHAQLPARSEVAALTRRIAALAQGILAMERCAPQAHSRNRWAVRLAH